MGESIETVVVGAGQAGLAISHELTHAGAEHVILERGEVGQSWRDRWDSFCLVTPNWTVQLPGQDYDGPDPDGFLPRDQLVTHFRAYADSFKAPVRGNVEVRELNPADGGGYTLRTSEGDIHARHVVIASGGYQKAFRPAAATGLPAALLAIDVDDYHNPGALPDGPVLVVGSGQTGCQLAEEMLESGRQVYLACGRAPWAPRRLGDHDLLHWLARVTPFLETTLADLPHPSARLLANPQASGHDGGHDLNYRTLQAKGVTLLGRLAGIDGSTARFAPDLEQSVAFGDARWADLCALIERSCTAAGIAAPAMALPPAFEASAPETLDLSRLAAVVFTSGFRPDYSWVHVPGSFDAMGFPIQVDGTSTVAPGLHFMGVHFQRKRKSATLLGVGEDASVLAERMTARA